MESSPTTPAGATKRFGWLQVAIIVLVSMLVTVTLTLWLVKVFLFPAQFTPVTLTAKEEQALSAKLEYLDSGSVPAAARGTHPAPPAEALEPEAYSEVGASREIRFSEREVNALLARNTNLAQRVAIDLADDLISARILVPVEPDFPMLGGRILRLKAGLEFTYQNERPVVRLKGVSIMGVPLPNAWLGGLKNVDLVQEFGTEEGFWGAFAAGVAAVQVQGGQLMLRLKE